jgi:hypothetical protein
LNTTASLAIERNCSIVKTLAISIPQLDLGIVGFSCKAQFGLQNTINLLEVLESAESEQWRLSKQSKLQLQDNFRNHCEEKFAITRLIVKLTEVIKKFIFKDLYQIKVVLSH